MDSTSTRIELCRPGYAQRSCHTVLNNVFWLTHRMAHMVQSDPRRQNSRHVFFPVYVFSLAHPTVGDSGLETQFVGSKIEVPSSSKLNEEGADLKEYARSLFVYVNLSLRPFVSLSLCISIALRLFVSLHLYLSLRLHRSASLCLYFVTSLTVPPVFSLHSNCSLLCSPSCSETASAHNYVHRDSVREFSSYMYASLARGSFWLTCTI